MTTTGRRVLHRRRLLGAAGWVAAGAGLGALATGCARDDGSITDLAIAGGESGGNFSKFALLLAGEIRRSGPVGRCTVTGSGGSVENLELLRSGRAQLGLALADSLGADDVGELVAVARLYQATLHCLVPADSPVRSVADLAGRVVAVGPAGSGSAQTAGRLFAGLAAPELREMAHGTGAISLVGGTVAALLWWGGRPSPELTALMRYHPLRALDLGGLVADAPETYQSVRIPGDVYGQEEVRTAGVSAHLVCRPELTAAAVRKVVDTLTGSSSELVPQPSGGLQYLTPATLFDTFPLRLHPTAAARYREQHG
ncbi:TAXI family TRAP transporter solute-binding subunit [Nocardioides alkalitolerans]|uniref:TAXI family TRAP transporter solute-binding subunit n=1 Tax=Nocardioides alkalitolerans TaxID=281714 RepID=UPI000406A78A|nr:TAXI family TRAP transporter solute-binding subunit [Nocardioides alkalitolerans]